MSVLPEVFSLEIVEVDARRVGFDDPWLMEDFTGCSDGCPSGLSAVVSFFSEAGGALAMASTGEDVVMDGPGFFMKALASKSCTRRDTLEDT